MVKALPTILIASALLGACSFDVGYDGDFDPDPRNASQTQGQSGIPIYSDDEIAGLLELTNTAGLVELDDDAAIDARAANNIIDHRAGADGILDTADDDLFDSFAELDEVRYVGPATLAKLVDYAYAAGFIPQPPAQPSCLIFSEYIEGQGNYNKAVELYNCGSGPITLSAYSICLVRNDDTTCTTGAALPEVELPAGEVFTACRTQAGTFNDPIDTIRDNCDVALGGVLTFNGNDRLLVFRDANGDGSLDSDDELHDSFGDADRPPADTPWADVALRRCQLSPYLGTAEGFDATALFTVHTRHDASDFGSPPSTDGCP
jgi:hypothetical protein